MHPLIPATLATLLVLSPTPSYSCATTIPDHHAHGSWKAYFAAHHKPKRSHRKPASEDLLPSAGDAPWGGSNAKNWKPEAVMANAVSAALNEAYQESGVADVLVALPVKMRYSGNEKRVYGDGQTNAAVDLGETWGEREPVLVATLIRFHDGSQKLVFKFHRKLGLNQGAKLVFKGGTKEWAAGSRTAEGDTVFSWKPAKADAPSWGDLYANQVAFLQPQGWKDWFPVDFRDVVISQEELLEQVPAAKRKLGKGNLLDPELVSVQGKRGAAIPFAGMESESFGKELGGDRYFPVPGSGEPQGIHNTFLGGRVTAVGRGFTTVFQAPPKSQAPFKLAYICFDARDAKAEAKYGVPSGGGWHEVGDEAETVVNSLERAPVLFGYANGMPVGSTPSGGFAYGLSDIAVVRKLQPGMAIVTSAGATTYGEDTVGGKCMNAPRRGEGGPAGRNYHWFAFDQDHEVCALEWVHPNVPTKGNRLGFASLEREGCR